MTLIKNTFSALVWTSSALAQKCPVALEGRIPAGSTPATFDITASPFDSKNVKGQNLTFAEIIQLPTNLSASLFDTNNTIPLLLTLSGQSIFAPSADNIQTGFRRCELLPATNNGTDASTLGQKIIHFSVMKDDTKPLNTTHGYQMVFLESADFSTNQIVVKTGTISGLEGKVNAGSLKNTAGGVDGAGEVAQGETLVVEGNINTDAGVIFEAAFSGGGVWHNFGLVMDFDANTTQVLYSQNSVSLAAVTQPVANDISGQGQYHFGLLKKPSGDNITDVTKEGFQPSGINEGVFYGGLFVEEGAGGCLSLSA